MDPWVIIGWAVVAVIFAVVLLRFILPFVMVTVLFVIHLKTEPEAGQVWMQPFTGREVQITFINDQRIGMQSYMPCNKGQVYTNRSILKSEWKNYQRQHWMHLDRKA